MFNVQLRPLARIEFWAEPMRSRFKVHDVFEGDVGTPDIESQVNDFIYSSSSTLHGYHTMTTR